MALKTIIRYFVRGCLVATPLGLTIYIVYVTLKTIDTLLPVPIPGLGLLVTVALMTLIGFLTSNVMGRSAVDFTDRILSRVPLIKLVYTSIKDLIGAFVGDKKSFTHPVALNVGGGLKVLGFVTRDELQALGMPGYVAVYLPQSYNFAGNLVMAPRASIEPVKANSSELVTFIVSGGVSGLGAGPPGTPGKTLVIRPDGASAG